MSTSILSRKWLTWISFLNLLLTHLLRCEICVQGKNTRKSFPSITRTSEPLELIHSDVCDSNRVLTRGGRRYFVTFIDDYSKFCHTYLLKFKEVLDWFKVYKAEAENQREKKIKILRSDCGGEYTSNDIESCQEHDIIHEVTAPYTPQSNGVAERKNRTLMDMVNCMLLSSGAVSYTHLTLPTIYSV